jgi:hypothetical protein
MQDLAKARALAAKAQTLEIPRELEADALALLMIETLETRGLDSLDFHDTHVATFRHLIALAYDAGRRAK